MSIILPHPKSLHPAHPVNRLKIINHAISGGDGVPPVVPRVVTHPGNVSMYDYLQSLKSEAELALEVTVQWP